MAVLFSYNFPYFIPRTPLCICKKEINFKPKTKKDMAFLEFTLGNKKLEIDHCDIDMESPRENYNLGTFVNIHEPSNGDKTDFEFKGKAHSREQFIEQGIKQIKKHFKDVAIVLPVHMYKHSGSSYSTSHGFPYNCEWDSGTVGFVFATKEDIRKNFMVKRVTKKLINKTSEILSIEIDEFSLWANGETFGFTLSEDGKEIDDQVSKT